MSQDFYREDLEILQNTVENPVQQMIAVEVASPDHSRQLVRRIQGWSIAEQRAQFFFDANSDNANELWQKAHHAAKDWQGDNGLLLIADISIRNARIQHQEAQKPTALGFWRAMNQLREKWGCLPAQLIFLVTADQYPFFTTEADHLKRWIPLKLHWLAAVPVERPQELQRFFSEVRSAIELPDILLAGNYIVDNLDDKKAAERNRSSLQERLRLAVQREETEESLGRRYYLPLMAAAITLKNWEEAENYDRALASVSLELKPRLRWLRLRAFLEAKKGHLETAIEIARERNEIAREVGGKFDKLSALYDLRRLYRDVKDLDSVEDCFLQSLQIDPQNANNLGSYANFLCDERRDIERAEEFYKRALEVDPQNANNLGSYANFLCDERRDIERAEEFYKRALEVDPQNAINLGNYALFLRKERRDIERAEEFYKRALEVDPQNANNLGSYAIFLWEERRDIGRAEEFYKRALEVDPQNANNLGNYANFLANERQDIERAEEFYKRALEVDPQNANNLGNYANFLANERQDIERAEVYAARAADMASDKASRLINYAAVLLIEGRLEEGKELLNRAAALPNIQSDEAIGLAFDRYIHFPREKPLPLTELKRLLKEGKTAPNWTFEANIKRAQQDKHPNLQLVRALATVIAGKQKVAALNNFPEWRKA